MGAVAKAVTNVVSGVVEAVGDAVEDVVDVVKDVGSAIDDYVLQPIKEDPVSFAIQVAATAAGVPPPITAAAITAAKGGDLDDIGKSALAAYVAPKAGAFAGEAVANATAGSALQNVAASAAAGAASSATSAAITGGDIGASALIGAAGGAGAAVGRDIATSFEYDTTPFSEQTQQIISQDVGVNPVSQYAADFGAALGRGAVTGDFETELINAASSIGTRETADLLREAFATATESNEAKKAEEALTAELENNPSFQEQVQLAQIANGDEPLSTDQKIDALAEAIARDAFSEGAAGGEQVAALPLAALPIAVNAAARAAQVAAPVVVRKIAQFAANDPRFAQVMVTNPYVQQLLAAAGLTMSVTLTGDVGVDTINYPDQTANETNRLNNYAREIIAPIENVTPETTQKIEQAINTSGVQNARDELLARRTELQNLERQGFPVQKELTRIEQQLSQPIPTIDVTQPIGDPLENMPPLPGTLPPPTIDIPTVPTVTPGRTPVRTPTETPVEVPSTRPGQRPGTSPTEVPTETPADQPEVTPGTRPGERPGQDTAAEPAPEPAPRTQPELTPKTPSGPRTPGGPRVPTPYEPIDIDELFTDQDILDLIRSGLGDEFADSTIEASGVTDATEGETPAVVDSRTTVVPGPTPAVSSLTSRSVGTGPGAITGIKEPTFGGDPGAQKDVWNVRSLRLRKALGL